MAEERILTDDPFAKVLTERHDESDPFAKVLSERQDEHDPFAKVLDIPKGVNPQPYDVKEPDFPETGLPYGGKPVEPTEEERATEPLPRTRLTQATAPTDTIAANFLPGVRNIGEIAQGARDIYNAWTEKFPDVPRGEEDIAGTIGYGFRTVAPIGERIGQTLMATPPIGDIFKGAHEQVVRIAEAFGTTPEEVFWKVAVAINPKPVSYADTPLGHRMEEWDKKILEWTIPITVLAIPQDLAQAGLFFTGMGKGRLAFEARAAGEMRDLKVLGLPTELRGKLTDGDVQHAYWARAKELHPDVTTLPPEEAGIRMGELNEAYERAQKEAWPSDERTPGLTSKSTLPEEAFKEPAKPLELEGPAGAKPEETVQPETRPTEQAPVEPTRGDVIRQFRDQEKYGDLTERPVPKPPAEVTPATMPAPIKTEYAPSDFKEIAAADGILKAPTIEHAIAEAEKIVASPAERLETALRASADRVYLNAAAIRDNPVFSNALREEHQTKVDDVLQDVVASNEMRQKIMSGEVEIKAVLPHELPVISTDPRQVTQAGGEALTVVHQALGNELIFYHAAPGLPDGVSWQSQYPHTAFVADRGTAADVVANSWHETWHYMMKNHPDLAEEMFHFLKEQATKLGMRLIRERAGWDLSPAREMDEMGANLFAASMEHPDFLLNTTSKIKEKFGTAKARQMIQEFMDSLSQLIDKARALIEKHLWSTDKAKNDAYRYVKNFEKVRSKMEDVWAEVIAREKFQKAAEVVKSVEKVEEKAKEELVKSYSPPAGEEITEPELRTTLSTSVPTSLRTLGDAYTHNWLISGEQVRASATHVTALVSALRKYSMLSGKGTAAEVMKEFHETAVSNLLWLHDMVPPALRARAKQWFAGINRIIKDWSAEDGYTLNQHAGVMAVLSPQKDWFMNVGLADRTRSIMKEQEHTIWTSAMTDWAEAYRGAKIPPGAVDTRLDVLAAARRNEGKTLAELSNKDASVFVRAFDEVYHERNYRLVTPEGGFSDYVTGKTATAEDLFGPTVGKKSNIAWGSFDSIEKAVSILRDGSNKNIHEQLGNEHKVRSFYNNILDPLSTEGHVTIDTHGVGAAVLKPVSGASPEVRQNFGSGAGSSRETGAQGTYGILADVYRDAAAKRGLLVHEFQAIDWEAVRGLFPRSIKKTLAPKIDAVWKDVRKGNLTIQEAREKIYMMAGGIDKFAWEGGGEGLAPANGGKSFEKPSLNLPQRPAVVNIGLKVGETGSITPQEAAAAIERTGAKITQRSVQKSATEDTLVASLDRPLTPAEAHAVAVETKQEAIAQMHGTTGELHGPGADKWRPFNPDYFLNPLPPRDIQYSKGAPPIGVKLEDLPKGARVPRVQWNKDQFRSDVETMTEEYRGLFENARPTVYRAYVAMKDVPRARTIDSGPSGSYDWSEYKKTNVFPPATIVLHENGVARQLDDGNHRVRYWREQGFTHIPAWIVDFRKGARPVFTKGEPVTVYSTRHAQTADDKSATQPEKHSGQSNPPLDERGKATAERTAEKLANTNAARIISSPLDRALSTAEAISRKTGVPVEKDPRLLPLEVPDLVGKVGKPEHFEEIARLAKEEPNAPIYGGESFNQYDSRLKSLYDDVRKGPSPVVMVGHSNTTRHFNASQGDTFDHEKFNDIAGTQKPGEFKKVELQRPQYSKEAPTETAKKKYLVPEEPGTTDKVLNWWKKNYAPELISENAMKADPRFAQMMAATTRGKDVILKEGEKDRAFWKKVPEEEQLRFLEQVENGLTPEGHPEYPAMAERIRAKLDQTHKEEEALGSTADYIENYLAHRWTNSPSVVRNVFAKIAGTHTMGSGWFTKPRSIDLIKEGMEAGLKLKTTNPEELVDDRLIAGVIFKEQMRLLRDFEDDGMAVKHVKSTEHLLPLGWTDVKVNSPLAQQYLIHPDIQPLWANSLAKLGMYQREGAWGGIFRTWMVVKNMWVPIKLMASMFHPLHVLHINWSNFSAQAQHSLMKGDIGTFASDVKNMVNVWPKVGREGYAAWPVSEKNQTPRQRFLTQLMVEGGFSARMAEEMKIKGREALRDAIERQPWFKLLGSVPFLAIRRGIEVIQHPLFEVWIPTMKIAAYLNAAAKFAIREPEKFADDQQRGVGLRAISKSMEDRYGQMFYKALFINPVVKDVGIASFISMGWNLGFVRAFGGAILDAIRKGGDATGLMKSSESTKTRLAATDKPSFAAHYLGWGAIIAGFMTYMLVSAFGEEGEDPTPTGLDYFFPRTGGKLPDGNPRRASTMFYNRELVMAIKHIQKQGDNVTSGLADMIFNKMVWGPAIELALNRDYYGNQIWSETAAYPVRVKQLLAHLIKQVNPITVTGAQHGIETGGAPIKESVLAGFGFGPSPAYVSRSNAENLTREYYRKFVSPELKTAEMGETYAGVAPIRNKIKIGTATHNQALIQEGVQEAIALGLNKHQIKSMFEPAASWTKMFGKLPDKNLQEAVLDTMKSPEAKLMLLNESKPTKARYVELLRYIKGEAAPVTH